eukprot:TRINITY_DN70688_c0_g1_i1.p1 TRINITY_DN70688_c0_g1~~TRINITY_DN70688_c0_g1_i1.p1  ORF type:complete len:310 (+),score=93.55 TRINITY_DN70688_c0_g1_i1:69-932(+)
MGKEAVPFDPWHAWWYSSPFAVSMIAGGAAGLTVDLVLFPLDALKTRLQSRGGLRAAGGLSSPYRGIAAAALGSVPCSALFFVTYESAKGACAQRGYSGWAACAVSAACGEAVACSLRTPAEILKQRMQVGQHRRLSDAAAEMRRAGFRGMVGFKATAARDVPFSMMQYPMYEFCKRRLQKGSEPLPVWQAALVGAMTGAISAFLTTPIDVCKTRCMLRSSTSSSIVRELRAIHAQEGVPGWFRGAATRAVWMGLGGLLFLGSYEQVKSSLDYGSGSSDRRADVAIA